MTMMTEMKKTRVIGIDYSMSCPAICIHPLNVEWSLDNCKIYFYTTKKKNIVSSKLVFGELQDSWEVNEERYYAISNWLIKKLEKPDNIFIEGYSYASKGLQFNVGENTGILKHYLWKNGHSYTALSPGTIKKFASGKGNANKSGMLEAFKTETNFHMEKHLLCKDGASPAADAIDAYYICKYGYCQLLKKE